MTKRRRNHGGVHPRVGGEAHVLAKCVIRRKLNAESDGS